MIIIDESIKTFVKNKLQDLLPRTSGTIIHGTFASGKSKYVSDIDLEVYLNYHRNTDILIKDFQDLILDGTKISWHLDRVEKWQNGERIAPITIDMALR